MGLLADVLALWAYTSYFSSIQHFAEVESDLIPVVARELGTNIPRIKIIKPDIGMRRNKQNVVSTNDMDLFECGDHDTDSDEGSDKGTVASITVNSLDAGVIESMVEADRSDDVYEANAESPSTVPEKVEDASERFEMNVSTITSVLDMELTAGSDIVPSVTESQTSASKKLDSPLRQESSPLSSATDIEAITLGAIDRKEVTSIPSILSPVDIDSKDEMKVKGVEKEVDESGVSHSNGDLADRTSDIITSSDSSLAIIKTDNEGMSGPASHKDLQIMEPNEPVYMGSKKYGKLFTFWQVDIIDRIY